MSAHHYFQANPSELCCLVVDSGYSFTHITPYCRGRKMKEGICRWVSRPHCDHSLSGFTHSAPLILSLLL